MTALTGTALAEFMAKYGRGWNFTADTYSASQQVDVTPGCFGFMFTNLGDVIARINGVVVFPSATPLVSLGDSRSLSAHLLDFYKGNLSLVFQMPTAGTAPLIEIIQLFYVSSQTEKI